MLISLPLWNIFTVPPTQKVCSQISSIVLTLTALNSL